MTEEAKKKLDSIFDESLEYEIVERKILPERLFVRIAEELPLKDWTCAIFVEVC